MPTLHAVTGLIRAGNTRKGADSLSNFCLDGLIIKLVKLIYLIKFIELISYGHGHGHGHGHGRGHGHGHGHGHD